MEKMKRHSISALALIFALLLIGCGASDDSGSVNPDNHGNTGNTDAKNQASNKTTSAVDTTTSAVDTAASVKATKPVPAAHADSVKAASDSRKAERFLKMFEGKSTYHIKVKMKIATMMMDIPTDVYAKDGMAAVHMSIMGMNMRVITRDHKQYTFIDLIKSYSIQDADVAGFIGVVDTTGMTFAGEGSGTIDGKSLPYEEYSVASDRVKVSCKFFMRGDDLAGIRIENLAAPVDMIISEFNTYVPDSIFDVTIPNGYWLSPDLGAMTRLPDFSPSP